MKKAVLVLLAAVLTIPAAIAATADEVAKPIHQFIDGFNTGDVKSAYAAYASGDIVIIDEFAPHVWTGPHAAQDWAADYEKNAQARGVSDGSVKYGAATRSEVEGDAAYVVIPTVYNYKEKGEAKTEEGQMTFALSRQEGAWKIKAWAWTGVKPHAAK